MLRVGLLGLAAASLSSCECPKCNGEGYVQVMGGAAPLMEGNRPPTPKELITTCHECGATGRLWALGTPRAKEDVDREKLNTIRIY